MAKDLLGEGAALCEHALFEATHALAKGLADLLAMAGDGADGLLRRLGEAIPQGVCLSFEARTEKGVVRVEPVGEDLCGFIENAAGFPGLIGDLAVEAICNDRELATRMAELVMHGDDLGANGIGDLFSGLHEAGARLVECVADCAGVFCNRRGDP